MDGLRNPGDQKKIRNLQVYNSNKHYSKFTYLLLNHALYTSCLQKLLDV